MSSDTARRFHGLDAARSAAMLLGVFYHLPIAFMGGFGFGFGAAPSPKIVVDEWLHSFRMPLFFLISGFFACMMVEKYGVKKFLLKRWWRIGVPLAAALLLLAGYRFCLEKFSPPAASPFGAPPMGTSPFGGPPMGASPFGGPPMGASPFGGPPMGGSPFGGATMGGSPVGGSPFGPPPAGDSTTGASPFGGPPIGAGPFGDSPMAFGGPPMAVDGSSYGRFQTSDWSASMFGDFSKHLRIEHLWFLWYLLVMVTTIPFVLQAVGRVLQPVTPSLLQGFRWLLRWNLAGTIFAVVSLPALIHGRGMMGWSLSNPHGFMGTFPDFLVQYCPDWPFYGLYFCFGWLLFKTADHLKFLQQQWMWSLTLGVAAFWYAQRLSTQYSMQPEAEHYSLIRMLAFLIYGAGTAYSAFGFLGFFERFLNQSNRFVRYLADSALWVYLFHLPLIPHVIGWVEPAKSSWWVSSAGGMLLITGISLLVYELIILPTPLVYVFGAAKVSRPAAAIEQQK